MCKCVCVCVFVTVCSFNGIVQAESYLLFYKGPDIPPREKRHIRCHYREPKCLCRERDQICLSVCLSVCLSFYLSIYLSIYPSIHPSSSKDLYINIFFSDPVIRAKISGEKIVSPSNNSSPYMKMIQYEIKMIKVISLGQINLVWVHQPQAKMSDK